MAAILVLVAVVYWPVHQNWFVWDDKILIHDNAWFSVGSGWRDIVIHGIPDWRYFRPLGLALFVLEIRLFGITPGPMHLVSLLLHLANTSLVGALAWQLRPRSLTDTVARRLVGIAMLVYGLHPALVEPVAWIASQFDLLLTLFVLLGLLANLTVQRVALRALAVSTCFLVAAFAKEAALGFPVLLFLLDWMQSDDTIRGSGDVRGRFMELIRRQRWVYLSVVAAGIVYLILRYLARAKSGAPLEYEPLLSWARPQTIAYTYLTYWRMILCPFVGLSPAHIVADGHFAVFNLASLAIDLVAAVIGATGLVFAWRRHPLGILIVGVTAMLAPVLHVVPVAFDDSLYHERYAISAIALACALLPRLAAAAGIALSYRPAAIRISIALVAGWLLLAVLTVRTTVPLWFDDEHMWLWALRTNPDSTFVMTYLIDTYENEYKLANADKLAEMLMSKATANPSSMMSVADLALMEGDTKRAAAALKLADKALSTRHVDVTHTLIIGYVILNGNLHLLENDSSGAEAAFRDAISLDPMRPSSYMPLALLLARDGRTEEARKVFDKSVSLAAPDVVAENRVKFARAMAVGTHLRTGH